MGGIAAGAWFAAGGAAGAIGASGVWSASSRSRIHSVSFAFLISTSCFASFPDCKFFRCSSFSNCSFSFVVSAFSCDDFMSPCILSAMDWTAFSSAEAISTSSCLHATAASRACLFRDGVL